MTTEPLPTIPDPAQVRAALALACRAPSVHNTQPWHWDFDGAELRLSRDATRLLGAADPQGRQAVISCGAVLHHARTAFAAAGWHTDTTRLPEPTNPDLLARIGFRRWTDPPAGVFRRAAVMEHRYTDRLPLDPPRDWQAIRHELAKLTSPHHIGFDVLPEDARERLAAASEHSDALRRYDMEYQSEIHWWAGHSLPTEGVPAGALASEAEAARVGVARGFPAPAHPPRRAAIVDRSRLAVLSAAGDGPAEWLHAGEALSAVLLECAAAGLSTCALTHITEHPAGRRLLAALAGGPGIPQILVRIGSAPGDDRPERTPRRRIDEVLTVV
ncbi:Acg family FMN-binding oxidoreductase [Nocardia thailandica]